jgi:serine phosphatase RsbU (regulator of sigma subunit)
VKLFGRQIAPADVALAVAGVLGTVCFFWLLPGQHPHAAADYRLTPQEATDRSRALLAENGFDVQALEVHSQEFRPSDELLGSVQRALGRPAAVDSMQRAPGGETLPAYGWHVDWRSEDHGENGEENAETDHLDVSLNERGQLWKLSWRHSGGRYGPGVSRAALTAALPSAEATQRLDGLPDSVLTRYLRFDTSLRRRAGARNEAPDTTQARVGALVEAFRKQDSAQVFTVPRMGRPAAVRLARYHLNRSALGELRLRADSVWANEAEPGRRAHVRFTSTRPVWGQRVAATVEVTSGGALRALNTNFEAGPGKGAGPSSSAEAENQNGNDANPNRITLSAESTAEVIVYLTYGLLFLVVAVLFFRRLSARALDAQAALRDALWGGFFAGAAMGLLTGRELLHEAPGLWAGLGIAAVVVLSAGLGGALLVFVLSSPADSLAREVWPQKIESLSLLRRFSVRNVPVGTALLRGSALGGVLVGLATLVLLLFPQAALVFEGPRSTFLQNGPISPFGYLFPTYAWISLVYMLMVLLTWGSLLQRWAGRAVLAGAGVVAVFVLGQAGPYTLAPVGYSFALAGLLGTTLAGAFWRYDALTCFTGYLLMGLLWGTAPSWMIDAFPAQVDFLLALAAGAATLGLGLVGVRSGRTGRETENYTPSYIEELAERKRLERDIEIAEEVQRSFLPRYMPQTRGLDVAALCLPAREVGGDYYDFIELPEGRLGVVIGDVSGKGIEASFYMTLAKGFLQTLATAERSPAAVLRRLNALFRRNAPRGTFITMIYGVVDPAAGTFRFARAGHNPLAHCRSQEGGRTTVDGGPPTENGRAESERRPPNPEQRATNLIRPRGMAIGLTDGPAFDDALEEVTLPLAEGDALVLYTDGLPEARDAAGHEFGEARVRERIQQHGHRPARGLLQTLADDVHAFVEAAGRHDDTTVLVVKRAADPSAVSDQPSTSRPETLTAES